MSTNKIMQEFVEMGLYDEKILDKEVIDTLSLYLDGDDFNRLAGFIHSFLPLYKILQ
jgi:hypothetical protein